MSRIAFLPSSTAVALLAFALVPAAAEAQSRVQYGRVTNVAATTVNNSTAQTVGTLVGGGIGLATWQRAVRQQPCACARWAVRPPAEASAPWQAGRRPMSTRCWSAGPPRCASSRTRPANASGIALPLNKGSSAISGWSPMHDVPLLRHARRLPRPPPTPGRTGRHRGGQCLRPGQGAGAVGRNRRSFFARRAAHAPAVQRIKPAARTGVPVREGSPVLTAFFGALGHIEVLQMATCHAPTMLQCTKHL